MTDNPRKTIPQPHHHNAIADNAIIAHYLDEYLRAYVSDSKEKYRAVHAKVVRMFKRNVEALDFFTQLDNYLQSPPSKHPHWLKGKIKTAKETKLPDTSATATVNSPDTDIQTEARTLISEGFKIIRIAKKGKVPYTGSQGVHGTYAPTEFKTGDNFGIKTGTEINGYYLVVVDIDLSQKSSDLREAKMAYDIENKLTQRFGKTLKVETGGKHKGTHLYYLSAEQLDTYQQFKTTLKDSGGKPKKIEVISTENKYVLAPGSKVIQTYKSNTKLRAENITTTSGKELLHEIETLTVPTKSNETPKSTEKAPSKQKGCVIKSRKTEKQNNNKAKPSKNPPLQKRVQPRLKNIDTLGCKRNIEPMPQQNTKPVCDTRLTASENLWVHLLSEHARQIYPGSLWQYKGVGKSFRCVLHKEKKPSAVLYRRDDGAIVYHDFHDGKSFDVIEYFAYLNSDIDSVPITSNKQFMSYWSTELKKYIRENGIETGFSLPLRRYYESLDLSFMKSRFKHVLTAITDIAYMKIDTGDNYFLASKRFISKMTGLSDDAVNRTMNQLVFLGFLRKGENRATNQGITYRYYLQTPSQEDIGERYALLQANDLISYRNFKRDTVLEAFGTETADMIFRRDAYEERVSEVSESEITLVDTDAMLVDLRAVSRGYDAETPTEELDNDLYMGATDTFRDIDGGTP